MPKAGEFTADPGIPRAELSLAGWSTSARTPGSIGGPGRPGDADESTNPSPDRYAIATPAAARQQICAEVALLGH
jgi:hypothetical protein